MTYPEREFRVATVSINGHAVDIDVDDIRILGQRSWRVRRATTKKENFYVVASTGDRTLYLHRELMNPEKGQCVDHIDWNGLNNRRENLRVCSKADNTRHYTREKGACGFHGVFFNPDRGRYRARLSIGGKGHSFGYFLTAEEAALARDKAVLEHYGIFATLNFPFGVSMTKQARQ